MTDGPQGHGWWQASDLKWYPPELHPAYMAALPPPPTADAAQSQPVDSAMAAFTATRPAAASSKSTPDDDHAPGAGERPTRPSTGRSRHRLFVAGGVAAVIVLIGASALVWHLWQRRAVPVPFSRTPGLPVASPNPAMANNPVVADTAPRVVKVRSLAPSCQKVLEGSGFVVAPDRVMTNAHVVAGSNSVQVYASGNPFDAAVVSYDPAVDIA